MSNKIKLVVIGSLAILATLLLGACGVAQHPAVAQSSAVPGYSSGPGAMMGGSIGGMMGGGMGGMMGGGMTHAPARSAGVSGYSYAPAGPTVEPTPLGAAPVPVDQEIQITAASAQFTPTQVAVKPGETVRFVVTNRDPFLHNFVGQAAGIPFLNLPANSTQTVTWTVPVQTGTYTAVCTLHPGMSISIVVKK